MSKNVTQVHHVDADELTEQILTGVASKLKEFEKNFSPKEPTIWITRKEASKILSISLVTVSEWSKKSILKPYRIGNQIRLKRTEVEDALTKINN